MQHDAAEHEEHDDQDDEPIEVCFVEGDESDIPEELGSLRELVAKGLFRVDVAEEGGVDLLRIVSRGCPERPMRILVELH